MYIKLRSNSLAAQPTGLPEWERNPVNPIRPRPWRTARPCHARNSAGIGLNRHDAESLDSGRDDQDSRALHQSALVFVGEVEAEVDAGAESEPLNYRAKLGFVSDVIATAGDRETSVFDLLLDLGHPLHSVVPPLVPPPLPHP